MNKFFTCVDDYIDNKVCKQYINHYDTNVKNSYEYDGTKPLKIFEEGHDLVERICRDFQIQSRLDNFEIVKREEGSFMDNHYDTGDDLAFILYLNDNFSGGETVFENETIIKPKMGRLLLFSNGIFLHKVNKITKGQRYVIAGWFV